MAAPELDALAFSHLFAAWSSVFDHFNCQQRLIVLNERASSESINLGTYAIHQLLHRKGVIGYLEKAQIRPMNAP